MNNILKTFKRKSKVKVEPIVEPIEDVVSCAEKEVDSNLIKVRIEPNSEETKSQSLLGSREITTSTFSIGRRPGFVGRVEGCSDFAIRQVEPYTVSRQHCVLELYVDHLIVRDTGSRYGTIVNGVRLGGLHKKAPEIKLRYGVHKLVLGPRDSTMRFKLIVQ